MGVERGMVKCGGGWGSGEWVSRVGRFFRFFAELLLLLREISRA